MTQRSMGSAYMEWVKTSTAGATYNLANSGVKSYPLSSLPVDFSSLQLTGPGAYGYPPLVAALAKKSGVAPENIATALGTSGANHLAMAVLIEPGDEVIVEHPGYPLLWECASYHGAQIKFFERRAEDKFAINVDDLRKLITPKTKLIVITNLHNPKAARSPTPPPSKPSANSARAFLSMKCISISSTTKLLRLHSNSATSSSSPTASPRSMASVGPAAAG